jgi:hypothetical protein
MPGGLDTGERAALEELRDVVRFDAQELCDLTDSEPEALLSRSHDTSVGPPPRPAALKCSGRVGTTPLAGTQIARPGKAKRLYRPHGSAKGKTLRGSVSGGQVALAGRGLVQANGSSNEGRESLLIDFIVLVEVDCAPGVAFEA